MFHVRPGESRVFERGADPFAPAAEWHRTRGSCEVEVRARLEVDCYHDWIYDPRVRRRGRSARRSISPRSDRRFHGGSSRAMVLKRREALPPLRQHQVRYFGVFSNHHALRPQIRFAPRSPIAALLRRPPPLHVPRLSPRPRPGRPSPRISASNPLGAAYTAPSMRSSRLILIIAFAACATRGAGGQRAAKGEPCGPQQPCELRLVCCSPTGRAQPDMPRIATCQTPCRDRPGSCRDGCPDGIS